MPFFNQVSDLFKALCMTEHSYLLLIILGSFVAAAAAVEV